MFRPKHSAVFSSEMQLAAEDRLRVLAVDLSAPTVGLDVVERIARRPGPGGRVLDVLVGPAGAGKTTAMNALRRAWEHEHGRGSIVGRARVNDG